MNWQDLEELVAPLYTDGDPGHDLAHVRRVARSAVALCASAGGDVDVVRAAALLHDIVNLPKDHPERATASERAAALAEPLLRRVGFAETRIKAVLTAIREHSFSRGSPASSVESAVLQDADRLDALGAIGIMRTVTCGARLGAAYYHPTEPVPRGRALDDARYTLDHFEVKLFRLAALMNTEAGRREAERRTELMRTFVAELEREI